MKAAYILFGIIIFTILSSFTILSTAVDTINGLVKDGIGICTSATPDTDCQLMDGTNAFPSSGILRNFHYNGLQDSTYLWRGNNYDYREQVDISGVTMRHSWSTTQINGTPKMQIDSGDVIYEWVAEELLN